MLVKAIAIVEFVLEIACVRVTVRQIQKTALPLA
jgi:hypothetical protein